MITSVQQGIIAQTELAKLIVIETDGQVEVYWPDTDDEGRDLETHRKRRFGAGLAIQSKCSLKLRNHGRGKLLAIDWSAKPGQVVTDPRHFYFFAHLDLRSKTFADPVFLVPSEVVHAHHGRPRNGEISFRFRASLQPGSRDRWSPYRLPKDAVGRQVLELTARMPLSARLLPSQLERRAIVVLPRVIAANAA